MTDFSHFSTEELLQMYRNAPADTGAPAVPETPLTPAMPAIATPPIGALSGSTDVSRETSPAPGLATDIAKSAGIGAAKGAIGLGGMIGDLGQLIKSGLQGAGLSDEQIGRVHQLVAGLYPGLANAPTSADIQGAIESKTGKFYQPQTTPGQYAQMVGEFLPGMAVPGGGGLVRRGLTALGAGLGSEAAGQAIEGSPLEPYARVAGAVAGGMAPGMAGRVLTPLPTNPERLAQVRTLQGEGVTALTPGDITGNKRLQYFEQTGSKYPDIATQKAEQFTGAALQRAGIQGEPRATAPVIDAAFDRIGNKFDTVASRNSVTLDTNLGNELNSVSQEYKKLVPTSQQRPIVDGVIKDIGDIAAANNGILAGDAYMAMRSRLDKAARGFINSDPQASDALFGIRNALDDAMARSMTNPDDRKLLREARREYKNMIVLERAATGPGSDAAMGLISPSVLRNATVAQNRRAYGRGQGDFADLARAGEAIMKPLPTSGTAERLQAQRGGHTGLASLIGSGVGYAAGTALGHPMVGSMIGAAAGAAAPRTLANVALSSPANRYLSNQVFPNAAIRPTSLQGLLALEQLNQGQGGILGR